MIAAIRLFEWTNGELSITGWGFVIIAVFAIILGRNSA